MASAILATALLAALVPQHPHMSREPLVQVAATCFKSGEQASGTNKICFYNCMGSQVAVNVGLVDLCPLTIEH